MPRSVELITVHLPGALLAGGVENFVHQRLAVGVLVGQDVRGDFDEVGIQLGLVPVGEFLLHLGGCHAQAVLHQLIGFADQFHVAVFDAVVDHFDVVAGAVFAHPIATRRAVLDLGGDSLEKYL